MPNQTRTVKNWSKFQHYQTGDRAKSPEWIKVYRHLLDDLEWHELDGDAAKMLVNLWMLAAENGGTLPPIKVIAFRLRCTEKQINSVLSRLPHWIEVEASDPLAGDYQDATLEEEREEEENKKEKRTDTRVCEVAFDAYNTKAKELSLPQAERLTPQRRKKLSAILDTHGLQEWFRALENLEEQPFCLGQGPSGWRADFDFLVQPSSFQKVLEKVYARGVGPPQASIRTSVSQELEEEYRRRDAATIIDINTHRRIESRNSVDSPMPEGDGGDCGQDGGRSNRLLPKPEGARSTGRESLSATTNRTDDGG
jgi:hypothetical protein